MATIDKFMVRTPNSSKEKLSIKKCTSSEISHDSEDEEKTRKHGKRRQLKAQAGEDADKEDLKINGEGGKAAAGTCAESTVEISYEDYLTESAEPDLNEMKAIDESQNAGRDIRSFFSKGPATFKLQNPSFSTIKVKAEIHEPSSKLSGEVLARKSPVLLPGIVGKQKDGRKKCSKGCIEITDDDLVIEYLDDEMIKLEEAGGLLKVPVGIKSDEAGGLLKVPSGIKSDEAGGLLKAHVGIKSDEAGGLLKAHVGIKSDEAGGLLKAHVGIKSDEVSGLLKVPSGIKSDEAGGLLKVPSAIKSDEAGGLLKVPSGIKSDEAGGPRKVPSGIKSDEAGGLLKAPVGITSILKNNDSNKLENETITCIISELQIKESPIPAKIIDACHGEKSTNPEKAMDSMLNGSVTERKNMNDVLMGKQKQVQEPDSQKQKQNSDGASSNSKDKKAEVKKRGRGKGSQVNVCTKKECNDVDAGEKSVSRDDEETRLYMLPGSTSVSSVLVKPESSGEVPEEQVSELSKELKSNTKAGKLATVNMNQMTSQTESLKGGASPVTESEVRAPRRSQRQSAVAAIAAISIAMQDSCSKRQKKTVAEDDMENETIDLDSDAEPEEAKGHSSRRTNVPTKPKPDAEKIKSPSLAPIFVKRNANDSSKKSTPKLSAAEREAIQIKRNFLLSGVPVELKKIQNIQQLAALPLVDAPFPTHSHTYQGNSADERNSSTLQPWCLPEVTLNLKDPSETILPFVDAKMLHLGELTSLSNNEKSIDGDKLELGNLMDISKDVLPLLLSEVKFHNPSFPTDRVYHQLSLRKNRDSKTKQNDISKTSASAYLKESSVKSKKVSKRKKDNHSNVHCENAEDDCSETRSSLWTEKYAPTRANEIIGNWDACKKLCDWLTEWKQVVSRHSSNKNYRPDKTPSDDVSGDFESWDDSSSYADDDGSLCNTMLLLGAHGIGKTSMVYALAQELDFKVFEVNASGSRDGRYVLTQLQEATQSHQVSRGPRTDAVSEQREEPITDQPKEKTSGKAKTPKQSNPVGGFLARWSAKQSLFEPEEPSPKKRCRRTKSTECRSPSKKQQQMQKQQPQDTKTQNQDIRKPSLILFDEVDTVFDDDRGFWSAVQTFMKTTKRPIILTATDRHFAEKFGGRCETLRLRTPRLVNTASYVQLICLLENVRTSYDDLFSLVEFFNGDIRKTLLILQYWVDSGAARHLVSNQPVHQHVGTCHQEPQNLMVPELKAAEDQTVMSSGVTNMSKVQDSDDDFQSIVPRKRRRIQIWSDDESSNYSESRGLGSLSSPAKNVLQMIEDVSQSCSLAPSDSEFRCDSEMAVQELKPADEGLLLPLHRLSGHVLGVNNASGFSPLTQDLQKNCASPFFGCYRHQNSPILDQFIQRLQSSVAKQELCGKDSVLADDKSIDNDCAMRQASIKSLYDAYKNMSYTDIYCSAMRQRCADEEISGNGYWHLQDKADEAITALEALVLSVSGVRWKDCEGKQNASVEKESAALSDNDSQMQNNRYSRLFQENTSIVEGVRQSVLQPTTTLCTEYMPALRAICKSEELRKATSHRRRFYHYLSNALPTMRCSLFKNMALQFP